MLNIKIQSSNLDKLQKHIEFINKMMQMKTDATFQKFIQNKVLKLADKVTEERLIGGTTNDDAIKEYRNNHKIRDYDEGFILYNDTVIPANAADISGYNEGNFPVALAFEYGVGIVGQSNSNSENAWQYDINNYGEKGWVFVREDGNWERTAGYAGFEIYRNIAIEVDSKLKEWVEEYYEKEVL